MARPAVHTQDFEDAIVAVPVGSHLYSVDLKTSWAIGDAPNGGYLMAILYRVASMHFAIHYGPQRQGHVTPIVMQLSFVRKSSVGPAHVSVEDVKIGARTSILRLALVQNNKDGASVVKVAGYITMSDLQAEVGLSTPSAWDLTPVPPKWTPPPNTASGGTGELPADSAWAAYRMRNLDFRKAARHIQVYTPKSEIAAKGFHGVFDQWTRLRWEPPGGAVVAGKWTAEAAVFLLDIFPGTLAELQNQVNASSPTPEVCWFPTLTMNIELKKTLPREGCEWLYSRVVTKSVRNGRTDIEVVLLDEAGEIIGLANQTGLIMSSSRNLSTKM